MKTAEKKIKKGKSLTDMNESVKVHIYVTFLLITILGAWKKMFLTGSESAWNFAFFGSHIEYFTLKNVLLLLALFLNFGCKCAQNGWKKGKPF